MITDVGSQNSLRAIAGQRVGVASHVVVGVGSTAAAAGDKKLEFETGRFPVESVSIDYNNELVIYKTTIPSTFVGNIREVGLVTQPRSANTIVTDFSFDTLAWSAGTASSTYTRVGVESLRSNPGVSATQNASATKSVSLAGVEEIIVAYHVVTAPSSLSVRLRTDGSNYYSAALSTTTGYHISRISVASGLTTTGAPSAIESIETVVTSTGGASADVHFDAIATVSGQDITELTARHVLVSPKTKSSTRTLEIEYSLAVSV